MLEICISVPHVTSKRPPKPVFDLADVPSFLTRGKAQSAEFFRQFFVFISKLFNLCNFHTVTCEVATIVNGYRSPASGYTVMTGTSVTTFCSSGYSILKTKTNTQTCTSAQPDCFSKLSSFQLTTATAPKLNLSHRVVCNRKEE